MPGRTRANGEGSIFPYRNGFAAYVWVTKPDGRRIRKYVYGKTREAVIRSRRLTGDMQLPGPPSQPTNRDEDSNRRSAGESDRPGDPPHHPHCLPSTRPPGERAAARPATSSGP
ncbi:hypothetical protein PSN13_04035 [Micromonospora saelicesensis]|uniref:Uncharacterized protein n=1 Tax=Micromonospora saelicesensis TaxID=285676 RepID=A0A328NQK4_9ACTN|nr:hypothetical protein PSN13_04035 [Micromonospora saelicesensis]